MIPLIAAGILAATGIVGAVIGVYFVVDRRRVGWEISRRYKYESALGDSIKLMVRKDDVGEAPGADDSEEYRPTDTAYEFEVELVNTGNRHITVPLNILVQLDDEAKVVAVALDIDGEPCSRQWDWDRSRGVNSALVSIEFLNKGEAASMLVQTVDNSDGDCAIRIEQPGIAGWRMDHRRDLFRYAIAAVSAMLVIGGWAPILLLTLSSDNPDEVEWALVGPAMALFVGGQVMFMARRWLAGWLNRILG